MSFALVTTQHFERRARKFLRKHPDLRQALRDTLDDLNRDPFQPKLKLKLKLKLHSLSGNLGGAQAVSLTYSYLRPFPSPSRRPKSAAKLSSVLLMLQN